MYVLCNVVQYIISCNFRIVLKVMWFPFLWFPGGTLRLNGFPISSG